MVRQENAFRNREAEASAVGSAREKRIEDAFADGLRNPSAGVGEVENREVGSGRAVSPSCERDRAAIGHGLRGVDQQVEEDLLDLAFVRFDEERACRWFEENYATARK